jgi:excinuclease ABC subunit C
MERLFSPGNLPGFGPCALAVGSEPPMLTLVHGQRSPQLRSEVRRFCPRKPGVYGMLNRQGELIYIGKAKSLRARLLSYFRRQSRGPKAGRILRQTGTIAWEVSASEFAALHRELELIRRWRPRFNIQGQPLRRRFTFLCLGRSPAPYAFLSARPPTEHLGVFGPIPFGDRAREAVRRLNDWFQLRDCPQAQQMIFAEETELFSVPPTPGCLRYEFGTCLGPCVAACSRAGYGERVRATKRFLSGTDVGLLETLERDMQAAAAAQQFERAAGLRDKLVALTWLHEKLGRQRLHARESFIYPVRGWSDCPLWYLIHAGRTVAALPAPHDQASARRAAELIDAVYHQRNSAHFLESYEHYDGRLLVSAWFRRHPTERRRLLQADQAVKLWLRES